jgi:prepilin-type processing-associated H-X9-DG protein
VRTLVRLALVVGLAIWAWRYFVRSREPQERATVAFADGSAVVLEPGSAEFERLASVTRSALDAA